jgi:hypothetical protein
MINPGIKKMSPRKTLNRKGIGAIQGKPNRNIIRKDAKVKSVKTTMTKNHSGGRVRFDSAFIALSFYNGVKKA